MSDDQIITLSRALAAARLADMPSDDVPIDRESYELGDSLSYAVCEMGERDPERVKRIVQHCANSEAKSDWEFAAYATPGVVDHDWEFVRDTLIRFVTDPKFKFDQAREHAEDLIIPDLMRDQLTREQVVDFNAALMDAGAEQPIMPSVDRDDPTNNPWFNR
ncbi:hypothetical protein [Nocardia brasiliensis]|uniref:hypothetical protein n=1 Tax=Nocardia brasiliensis TaxID=37326 RepID=UPI002456DCF9|nr:hypothetical protein [Nocardia brasiliensis]